MPLESTMICVDNSEFMRNGDYVPTRLQAQQDAVNTVCRYKLLANPENNVGLLTLANTEVLATLTTDAGKILTSLHRVQPSGFINILTGIRIAHLSLKHRQGKNHKMRIVVFVGSPIEVEEKEVVKMAKRLKKENVNLDVINFGETEDNQPSLEVLINTINGREGAGSHLVTIPPSPRLADALMSSPIIQGEDGSGPNINFGASSGFEFGVDPNEDPELALALRVSMEEQRQRQQEEERRVNVDQPPASGEASAPAASTPAVAATPTVPTTAAPTETAKVAPTSTPASPTAAGAASEDEMLQQALAMSLESGASGAAMETTPAAAAPPPSIPSATSEGFPDFSSMTEEEQIAYAMQISLQGCQTKEEPAEPMDVDKPAAADSKNSKVKVKIEPDQDFSEVISDPAFLTNVLQSLPGVNPQSQVVKEAVEQAVGSVAQDKVKKEEQKKDEKDIKKEEKE